MHSGRRVKRPLDEESDAAYRIRMTQPLDGLRVIEIDGLGPVTFAGMMLADMGAEVVRLTRTNGDSSFEDVGGAMLHRSRASVPVDLKSSSDRAAVLGLIERADILIEGFRPGVMERLGLGPEPCHARNPRLVYGRVTGWGQTGPLASTVGHDLNYIGLTGVLQALGEPDRPPPPPLNLIGDYGGGAMMLLAGVLAGVIAARQSGRGTVVDAAMTDGTALLAGLFSALRQHGLWSDARADNLLDGGAPFYRCYECKDGRFVAVGALEPRFYAALLAGLGLAGEEAPQYDRVGWPALHDRFQSIFAERDRDTWIAVFQDTEACVTPVVDWSEAQHHPHNLARGTFGADGLPAAAPVFDDTRTAATAATSGCLIDILSAWA